jgi:hypothetical protein
MHLRSSIDQNQGLDVKSVTAHHQTKSGEGFKVVSTCAL